MASKNYTSNYLIFHPERIGLLDVLRLLLTRRRLTSYSFVEASSSTSLEIGSATANWSIALTLIFQQILFYFSSILKWIGRIVEFALNLLSLNGGILSLIWRAIRGKVEIPKPGTAEFRSVIGHIDGRVDLNKTSCLPNYASLMNSDHQKDFVGIDLLDLSMMASKVAYENPAYIRKVVKDNWKMHFVRFFNCWNDILEDYTTQAFIFSDKAKDATKIYVAFRGTEPFDANDWKTDIDLSFISLNLDRSGKYTGRVHIGFLGALGLLKNFDPMDVFPEDKPAGVTQPLAYYTIREVLNNILKTNPKADILLTGHSLGGALAILFSFLLHAHKQTEILNSMDRVMTYGQPRVGDDDFASYMENFTGSLHQRMVYRYDLVPRVPFDLPPFSSFKHCGTCTYYTSWYEGQIFRLEPRVMKSPSAEEPPEGLEEGKRRISDLTSLYGTKRQRKMDDEERKKHAFILSYITRLVNFWKLAASSRRKSQTSLYGDAINKYKIPRFVLSEVLKLFLDPASNVLSTDTKELVIGYILVLTLFAGRFSTSPSDIAKDLGMTTTDVRLYYLQLGCKLSKECRMGKRLWTLSVPLKFTELKKRRKQNR